jgi:hypothetical protein
LEFYLSQDCIPDFVVTGFGTVTGLVDPCAILLCKPSSIYPRVFHFLLSAK